MRKKREKERADTCTNQSEINCFKCQCSTHKSNECPNQRVLMLRAKGFCEDYFHLLLVEWEDKTK